MKKSVITLLICLFFLNVFSQPGSTDPGPGYGCSNGSTVYEKWVGYKDPYTPGGNNKQSYFSLTGKAYTINDNMRASCTETNRTGPNGMVPVSGANYCIVTNNYNANNITYSGGILVAFKPGVIGCPLDSQISLLLITGLCFGFCVIRKYPSSSI